MSKDYYTIKEVSKRGKIEPLTIVFRISMGKIEVRKIGSRIHIEKSVAQQFIKDIRDERQKQLTITFDK